MGSGADCSCGWKKNRGGQNLGVGEKRLCASPIGAGILNCALSQNSQRIIDIEPSLIGTLHRRANNNITDFSASKKYSLWRLIIVGIITGRHHVSLH
jgi:hypothetical protein